MDRDESSITATHQTPETSVETAPKPVSQNTEDDMPSDYKPTSRNSEDLNGTAAFSEGGERTPPTLNPDRLGSHPNSPTGSTPNPDMATDDLRVETMSSPTFLVSPKPPKQRRNTSRVNPDGTVKVEYAMVLEGLTMKRLETAVLADISFAVPKGSCFAILGESGAGKSTLLKLLARRLELGLLDITGTGYIPSNIWYIPQDLDVLYEFDTPLGSLVFLHQFMYKSTEQEAQEAAVKLLDEVGFPQQYATSIIGKIGDGLTGGQRRLLSVAQALCAKAEVIMLDEPTTGLDSTSCNNIVEVLRNMCKRDHLTVICTIHQPNDVVLDKFDHVLVMSAGKAFAGFRDASFKAQKTDTKSEAEVLLTMVTRRLLKLSTIDEERSSIDPAILETALEPQLPFRAEQHSSALDETLLLLKRTAKRQWTNKFAFRFRFLATFALSLVIGVSFWRLAYDDPRTLRDHMGVYLALCGSSFVPIIIAASLFPSEKPSFLNEMAQCRHYSVGAFMVSRSIFEIGMAFATTWWIPVLAGMVGHPFSIHGVWLTYVLQVIISDSFGFMLATRVGPEVAIGALIPCVGLLSVLVGTGLASPAKEGSGWLYHVVKWISFFKYGFSAFLLEEFPKMTNSCNPILTENCAFPNADAVLKAFVYEGDNTDAFVNTTGFQWMMMIIFSIVLRFISFILLKRLVLYDLIRYETVTNWAALAPRKDGDEDQQLDVEDGSAFPTIAHHSTSFAEEASMSPDHMHASINTLTDEEVEVISQRYASFVRGTCAALDFGSLNVVVEEPASPVDGKPTGKRQRHLLSNVCGSARAGQVTALIGPSLSGKSVLLRVLSQQCPITGIVECSGNLELSIADEKQSTYTTRLIYQQDAFTTGDTVQSAVRRQIELARPQDTADVKAADCQWALRCVGLEHVATKRVVATSGGEQRRLSVACQLAHRPQVLLLDEPTSGLDSERALEVMQAIRQFAQVTSAVVLCTLQQPGKSLLPLLDELILMSDSRVVFRGPLHMAVEQFQVQEEETDKMAATDVILQRLDEKQGPEVFSPFDLDRTAQKPAKSIKSAKAGAVATLLLLVKRNMTARTTSIPMYITELVIKFISFPLFLAICFAQIDEQFMTNRMGLLFVTQAGMGFVSLIVPIVLMTLEREVFTRDINAGDYGTVSYQLARWIFELPGEFVGIVAGCGLMYAVVGFDMPAEKFLFSSFLGYQSTLGFGFMLAAAPLPFSVSAGLAGFFIIAFMLGCGVVVTPSQISRVGFVYILEFVAPIRHALTVQVQAEASTINGMMNVTIPATEINPASPPGLMVTVPTKFNGDLILHQLGLTRWEDQERWGWILLVITLVLYRVIALIMLEVAMRLQRRHFPNVKPETMDERQNGTHRVSIPDATSMVSEPVEQTKK